MTPEEYDKALESYRRVTRSVSVLMNFHDLLLIWRACCERTRGGRAYVENVPPLRAHDVLR